MYLQLSDIFVFFFQIFKEIAQKIKGTPKRSEQRTWPSALSLALQCSIFQDLLQQSSKLSTPIS